MAFFDQLQQRQPGQPRLPEVNGAPPRPSLPNTTVAPPGAASAPIGRPPAPPPPPTPGEGTIFDSQGGLQQGGIRPGGFTPSGMVPERPAKPTTPGSGSAAGGQAPGADIMQQAVLQVGHMPSPAEMATLQGFRVMTPYGEVQPDGSLIPSPEGAVKYQQAVVAAQKNFGPHPWANDPNAPQPKITLGRSMFNPITGQWAKAQG